MKELEEEAQWMVTYVFQRRRATSYTDPVLRHIYRDRDADQADQVRPGKRVLVPANFCFDFLLLDVVRVTPPHLRPAVATMHHQHSPVAQLRRQSVSA